MVAVPLAVGVGRVLLLQMGGVGEHQFQQGARGLGSVDRPMKALRHQSRQKAHMIYMRVGEQDGVEALGGRSEREPVQFLHPPSALEKPAVDQIRPSADLQEKARSGHRAGCAQEGKLSCHRNRRGPWCPLSDGGRGRRWAAAQAAARAGGVGPGERRIRRGARRRPSSSKPPVAPDGRRISSRWGRRAQRSRSR